MTINRMENKNRLYKFLSVMPLIGVCVGGVIDLDANILTDPQPMTSFTTIADEFLSVTPFLLVVLTCSILFFFLTRKLFDSSYSDNLEQLRKGNEADLAFLIGLTLIMLGMMGYGWFYYFVDSPIRLLSNVMGLS